jgi:hypothetical protein
MVGSVFIRPFLIHIPSNLKSKGANLKYNVQHRLRAAWRAAGHMTSQSMEP